MVTFNVQALFKTKENTFLLLLARLMENWLKFFGFKSTTLKSFLMKK